MYKHKLVDFVIHFMEEIDKEISEMKLSVNARARIVAEEFLKNVSFWFVACVSRSWTWSSGNRWLSVSAPWDVDCLGIPEDHVEKRWCMKKCHSAAPLWITPPSIVTMNRHHSEKMYHLFKKKKNTANSSLGHVKLDVPTNAGATR